MVFERFGPVCGPQAAVLQPPAFPKALKEISSLPRGFPAVLDSPLAWSGLQFKHDSEYVLCLTENHVREIEVALQNFKSVLSSHPSHGIAGDIHLYR